MTATPTKVADTSIGEKLTPVRFLDSPRQKSAANDANFATCKTRLETIIKTLQDNWSKWQLAEKRGLTLCQSIETLKTRALEAANKVADGTHYPKELKPYCDKLAIIASIFSDITHNARESLRQLRALTKLPGASSEIFYRSWQLPQFVDFVERVLACYEAECKLKQHVMVELPHCSTRVQLIRCASAWEYPQFVDKWVALMFTFLAEELSLSKKS